MDIDCGYDKKEVNYSDIFIVAESSFPAALNDDSNSNMSFPSPAPTSEDSQDAVSELQQKKENQLMKPIGMEITVCPIFVFEYIISPI